MKKLLFCLLLCMPVLAFAQVPQPFDVVGKFGNLNAKVYIGYQLGSNKILDSAQSVNGSFEFKGNLIYPSIAILIVDYKNVGADKLDGANGDKLVFYLDKGKINVQSPDSAYKAQIVGSPINDQYKKLVAISDAAGARTNKMMSDEVKAATGGQSTSVEQQNQLQAKLKVIQVDYHNALKAFIVANPDSYLSLLSLGTLGGP